MKYFLFLFIFQTLKAKTAHKSLAGICRHTRDLGVVFLRGTVIISGAGGEPCGSAPGGSSPRGCWSLKAAWYCRAPGGMLLWVPPVLCRERTADNSDGAPFPCQADVMRKELWIIVYLGLLHSCEIFFFATKVSIFGGGGGDLPPAVLTAAGAFGLCTDAEVQPSPCTAHFCLCSHLPRGLGSQRWGAAMQVPPWSKQVAGTESRGNGPKSVALGLFLTEAEMHLHCVKSVLVKWPP